MTLWELIADKGEMTDQECYDWLHTPSVAARQVVPRWQIKDYLYRQGAWPLLLQAQTNETPAIAGVALTAVAYLGDADFENLDVDLPEIGGMFDALQAVGVLDAEGVQRAAVNAMADTLITPLAANDLSATLLQVIRTRRKAT